MKRVLLVIALAATISLSGCLNDVFGGSKDRDPRDYLRDSTYTQWIIEIDYVAGHRPSQSAMDLLDQRMEELAKKPDGVHVRLGDELPATDRSWTVSAIDALKRQHLTEKTSGSTITTYVVYLDGGFATDTDELKTFGLAYGHDTVAIFHESISRSCNNPLRFCTSVASIERAVLVHELGHVIGLVNNGLPMVNDHEDKHPDHRRHSTNERSVMYWAVETNAIFNSLSSLNPNPPTTFDANDKADVCQAGGKC